MGKFRVGDIVIGNAQATDRYVVTTKGWLGIVIEVDINQIAVSPVYDLDVEYNVKPEYFELYSTFPEDVKT